MASGRRKERKSGRIIRNVLKQPATPADHADAARRQLMKLTGARPAMRDVPTLLGEAHWRELEARRIVDALVILGRHRGMTFDAIGGLIGTTKQGAFARHERAIARQAL